MQAFTLIHKHQQLDYREARDFDMQIATAFFHPRYTVDTNVTRGRHYITTLHKDGKQYLLKIATTLGISVLLQAEAAFDTAYATQNSNTRFLVPRIIESGFLTQDNFYILSEKFDGRLIALTPHATKIASEYLPLLLEFALHIECLQPTIENRITFDFLAKVKSWYKTIPNALRKMYHIEKLWAYVESNYNPKLTSPRHGDFAPWHIFDLGNGKLGVIDAEHALAKAPAHYDLGFLIQRVFAVNQDEDSARKLLTLAHAKGVDQKQLHFILVARAIGGFLDSYLANEDYTLADHFAAWVTK